MKCPCCESEDVFDSGDYLKGTNEKNEVFTMSLWYCRHGCREFLVREATD